MQLNTTLAALGYVVHPIYQTHFSAETLNFLQLDQKRQSMPACFYIFMQYFLQNAPFHQAADHFHWNPLTLENQCTILNCPLQIKNLRWTEIWTYSTWPTPEPWKRSVLPALSNLLFLTLILVLSVERAIWWKIVIQQHVINQSWNFWA